MLEVFDNQEDIIIYKLCYTILITSYLSQSFLPLWEVIYTFFTLTEVMIPLFLLFRVDLNVNFFVD